MAPWPFSTVAAMSLLLLVHPHGSSGSGAANTRNMGLRIDCFKQLNAARNLVGFSPFTDGKSKRETKLDLDDENFVATQCSMVAAMMGKALVHEPTRPVLQQFNTYAFALQKGPDCADAVEYWKDGFGKFKTIPGPYHKTDPTYQSVQATSFLALFNGQENPSMDCAFFLCPVKDIPGEGAQASSAAGEKMGYGLACLTAPDAYTKGRAPYTKEQWEKIKAGLSPKPAKKGKN